MSTTLNRQSTVWTILRDRSSPATDGPAHTETCSWRNRIQGALNPYRNCGKSSMFLGATHLPKTAHRRIGIDLKAKVGHTKHWFLFFCDSYLWYYFESISLYHEFFKTRHSFRPEVCAFTSFVLFSDWFMDCNCSFLCSKTQPENHYRQLAFSLSCLNSYILL